MKDLNFLEAAMNSNNTAFLFPGQGAQTVGMAKDLYENIPECKEILDLGESVTGMPLKKMMFEGPLDVLTATENAQPAIHAASLMALKALEINGIKADYAAGLSLGEYPALVYAGALSVEDSFRLVKERGRIMGSALPEGLGTMAAILRLDNEKVDEVIKRASEFGIIEGANYNCPGQVAVSGEIKAIDKAVEIAGEMGGRAVKLNVSGPFHSSLLKEASEEFYNTIVKADIKPLEKVVYSNVKGAPYEASDDIKEILKLHIRSAVLFEKTIRDMLDKGVTTFVEVGPGKALRGFIKKVDKTKQLLNVEDMKSLENTINAFKEN